MRGKVDDVVYVFIAAIVILVIALAAFAFIPSGGIGIVVPITNFTLGSVGFTGDNMVSRSYGDFKVGAVNSDTIKSVPQIEVSSNYFGGRSDNEAVNVLSAYVPLARQATITFTVHDSTPAYGKLIIKWNGMELHNEATGKGVYTLHVPQDQIKEVNNLQISCDGPGVYFWASTVYILRDVKVTLDYGSTKLIPFTLGSDIESFKNGAFEFSSSGSANLMVKVNGAIVFSKVPSSAESVKFDLFNSAVSPGNNLISLSTKTGTVSLSDVILKIFFSTGQTFKAQTFSLSQSNFSLFSQGYQGKIQFEVNSVAKQGTMHVTLNDHELNVPPIQVGTITLLFTEKEAKEGTNTIKFSGTGGWDVGTVSVWLER